MRPGQPATGSRCPATHVQCCHAGQVAEDMICGSYYRSDQGDYGQHDNHPPQEANLCSTMVMQFVCMHRSADHNPGPLGVQVQSARPAPVGMQVPTSKHALRLPKKATICMASLSMSCMLADRCIRSTVVRCRAQSAASRSESSRSQPVTTPPLDNCWHWKVWDHNPHRHGVSCLSSNGPASFGRRSRKRQWHSAACNPAGIRPHQQVLDIELILLKDVLPVPTRSADSLRCVLQAAAARSGPRSRWIPPPLCNNFANSVPTATRSASACQCVPSPRI